MLSRTYYNSVFLKMNFNAVCRTCLTTEELNPIFLGSENLKSYCAAIFVTTGIKVAKDDGLPQQMCACCISLSNAFLKFKKQCKDVEIRLLQMKKKCDGAAETLSSGAVDSEDFKNEDMQLELKHEEEYDVAIKSDADSEAEDNGYGALNTAEEDPLQLQPAGGAGAAPARSPARPGERPRCSTSPPQQLQLSTCFKELKRFPIEDKDNNLYACETCLTIFDCKSSLRNHSCTNSVEELNLSKVCGETADFKCGIETGGKQLLKKRHKIRHLAAHNVKKGGEKMLLLVYSSEGAKFSNTEEIVYPDNISETQFKNQSLLNTHTGERSGPGDVYTEFSQKQHFNRDIINLHGDDAVTVSTRERPFCDVCKKQFAHKANLTLHKRIHTGETPYCCSICNRRFTDKSNYNYHMRKHLGVRLYGCDICMKRYTAKSHLTEHTRVHTGEKPFACDVCKKRFAYRSNLSRHKEKPFRCSVFKEQLTVKSNMTIDMRRRSEGKLYSCDICMRTFKAKSHLIAHIKIHTGEKPFTCDVCKKRFSNRSNLNKHKRVIHSGEKPFSCDVCEKQFAQKSYLISHMRTHTGEKLMNLYSCDICKKEFNRKNNLTRHRITHAGAEPRLAVAARSS